MIVYVGCPPTERQVAEETLAAVNLSVTFADSASAVRQLSQRDVPVLFDLSHGSATTQVAREVRDLNPTRPMFAVVDVERPDLIVEAVLQGLADVFIHPLSGRRVRNAIERERRFAEGPGVPTAVEHPAPVDLYSYSAAMRGVVTQIELAATARAGVTIRGEDGTGRRVVAQAIHALRRQGAGPFRAVDCAALDGDQLDLALFGTGAHNPDGEHTGGLECVSRRGVLHEVNGGTLYLQNVSEAPARVQARLARILRDREAVLAETGEIIALDVRPIAAVAPDGHDAARDGRIREDLFRRLSAICIDVPPLRKRREDIPTLANYVVREISATLGVPPAVLSRSALSLICALPWRQNAIELRALLEAILGGLGRDRGIGIEHVLAHLKLDGDAVAFAYRGTLRQARNRFEREYIAAVLEEHRGRISEAAKALGIQRTNLYRKIRVLHVGRGKKDASPIGS